MSNNKKMYLKTIITDRINSKEDLLPISKHRYFKELIKSFAKINFDTSYKKHVISDIYEYEAFNDIVIYYSSKVI